MVTLHLVRNLFFVGANLVARLAAQNSMLPLQPDACALLGFGSVVACYALDTELAAGPGPTLHKMRPVLVFAVCFFPA